MLLFKEQENGVERCLFESSNILHTEYEETRLTLKIYFKTGNVYSYYPVYADLYENFKLAESTGRFFVAEIKNNPNILTTKEFKMGKAQIDFINEQIELRKKNA